MKNSSKLALITCFGVITAGLLLVDKRFFKNRLKNKNLLKESRPEFSFMKILSFKPTKEITSEKHSTEDKKLETLTKVVEDLSAEIKNLKTDLKNSQIHSNKPVTVIAPDGASLGNADVSPAKIKLDYSDLTGRHLSGNSMQENGYYANSTMPLERRKAPTDGAKYRIFASEIPNKASFDTDEAGQPHSENLNVSKIPETLSVSYSPKKLGMQNSGTGAHGIFNHIQEHNKKSRFSSGAENYGNKMPTSEYMASKRHGTNVKPEESSDSSSEEMENTRNNIPHVPLINMKMVRPNKDSSGNSSSIQKSAIESMHTNNRASAIDLNNEINDQMLTTGNETPSDEFGKHDKETLDILHDTLVNITNGVAAAKNSADMKSTLPANSSKGQSTSLPTKHEIIKDLIDDDSSAATAKGELQTPGSPILHENKLGTPESDINYMAAQEILGAANS
ncbi:hypothetical protein ENBRE01_0442 [Enteropsectra breve]|nr:hypothetical protein ENBRE01_0442 [Enteropsectra breve]